MEGGMKGEIRRQVIVRSAPKGYVLIVEKVEDMSRDAFGENYSTREIRRDRIACPASPRSNEDREFHQARLGRAIMKALGGSKH